MLKIRQHQGLTVLEFEGKKFRLRSTLDLRAASQKLGLPISGLSNALERYRSEGVQNFNVRSVPPATEREAWHDLCNHYSGLDRSYLSCVISALWDTSRIPLIICTGVSGAGKSGTAQIAARILGHRLSELVWSNRPETNLRNVRNSLESGANVLLFDEFVKTSRSNASLFDSALLFTRARLGTTNPCVCVFTDTTIPDGLFRLRQVTRRTRFFHLNTAVQWPNPADVLTLCPTAPNLSRYCNGDWYVDNVSIGHIVEILNAVVSAPPLPEKFRHRIVGHGWKAIDFESRNPLSTAWLSVCDATLGGSKYDCMQLDEINIAQRLKLPGRIVLEKVRDRVFDCLYVRVLWDSGDVKAIESITAEILRQ